MLSGTTAINLTERLEDKFGLFLAETTPCVYDREFEHYFIVAEFGVSVRDDPATAEDLTLGGELDRISDDVEEHLADSDLVSFDP